jgi:hypothetical protein
MLDFCETSSRPLLANILALGGSLGGHIRHGILTSSPLGLACRSLCLEFSLSLGEELNNRVEEG